MKVVDCHRFGCVIGGGAVSSCDGDGTITGIVIGTIFVMKVAMRLGLCFVAKCGVDQ